MPLFNWKSEYSVKVEELDIHHQQLFNIVNAIYDNCMKAGSVHCVSPMLDELLAFSDYHFDAEEQYMKDIGFNGLNSHISKHRAFADRIAALQLTGNGNDLDISKELIAYLGNWLLRHVMDEDKRYAECYDQYLEGNS